MTAGLVTQAHFNQILPYFALWPAPNGSELGQDIAEAFSNPVQSIREDFGNVRMDHNFSSRDTLSGVYTIDDGDNFTPGVNPLTQTTSILRDHVLSLQETHIFFAFIFEYRAIWFFPGEMVLECGAPRHSTEYLVCSGSAGGRNFHWRLGAGHRWKRHGCRK